MLFNPILNLTRKETCQEETTREQVELSDLILLKIEHRKEKKHCDAWGPASDDIEREVICRLINKTANRYEFKY